MANAEKLTLEEKLETSCREIRKYQDTLQQSQEQLEGAQEMIEDCQVCHRGWRYLLTGEYFSDKTHGSVQQVQDSQTGDLELQADIQCS